MWRSASGSERNSPNALSPNGARELQIFWPLSSQPPSVLRRGGPQRRQVAAGLGLRPGLRPDLLAAGHLRQHPVQLFFGAVREQRRRQHRGAVGAGPSGCAGAEVLLLVDHPLQQRGVAAAVLLGPGDHRQAGVEKHLVPAAVLLEAFGGVVGLRRERVLVGGEELAHLGPELRGVVVESQVHQALSRSMRFDHLAAGIAGQRVEEPHRPRRLEVRQMLTGVGDHGLLVQRRAGLDHDECLADLAEPLVGHADHRATRRRRPAGPAPARSRRDRR